VTDWNATQRQIDCLGTAVPGIQAVRLDSSIHGCGRPDPSRVLDNFADLSQLETVRRQQNPAKPTPSYAAATLATSWSLSPVCAHHSFIPTASVSPSRGQGSPNMGSGHEELTVRIIWWAHILSDLTRQQSNIRLQGLQQQPNGVIEREEEDPDD